MNLFCFLKSKLVVLIFRIVECKIVKTAVLVDAYLDFWIFGKGNLADFFMDGISVGGDGRMDEFFS